MQGRFNVCGLGLRVQSHNQGAAVKQKRLRITNRASRMIVSYSKVQPFKGLSSGFKGWLGDLHMNRFHDCHTLPVTEHTRH